MTIQPFPNWFQLEDYIEQVVYEMEKETLKLCLLFVSSYSCPLSSFLTKLDHLLHLRIFV